MRLYQKIGILCSIVIVGIFISLVSSVIIIKQSRRSIGEIYWKTVSQSCKLDSSAAIEILKKFIDKYPDSDYVEDACYNICKIEFKECVRTNKNWHKPLKTYFSLLNDYPKTKYLEPITFFIPFCQAKDKDYTGAISGFERFLKIFPNSDLVDEAQYNIGRLYWALGKFKQAKRAYELVVKNYPQGDLVDEALFRKGEVYLARGNFGAAISQFQQVSPKFAPYSRSMLGFCLYLQRRFNEAKQTLVEVLSTYPQTPLQDDIKEFIDGMFPKTSPSQESQDKTTCFLGTDNGIIYNKDNLVYLINFNKDDLDRMRIFPFNTRTFLSPSGNEFIVGSGDDLWKVSLDGRQKTRIAAQQGKRANILWSFDEKAIIYETENAVYLIRFEDNKPIKAVAPLAEVASLALVEKSPASASFFPVWSKNKIACLNWDKDGNSADLVIFDSKGNREKVIKRILDRQISLADGFVWSPDGQKIAYGIIRQWEKGIVEELRMVDVQRGIAKTLVYDSARDICWSPDSSRICYSNYRGTLVIDADGKNWQQLSHIRMGQMRWNSNQTLCGIGIRNGSFVYRTINLDGKTKKITLNGTNPILSKFGNRVVYNDAQGRLWLEDIGKQRGSTSGSRRLLTSSKITPVKWLFARSKIVGFDDKDYWLIDTRQKQRIYQGTPVTLLASFKNFTFVPKSSNEDSIFGNLGRNIIRLKDDSKELLTLQGGKNPVISQENVVYENAGNLWMMQPDGTKKFQLTLLGGRCPNWFGDKIIFEQPSKNISNWWDFDLRVNQRIHEEKGRIAKEYLLEVIQPVDSKENICIINRDGTNYAKLIEHGSNPALSISGKIAFERGGMIWVKDGEKEVKLVKGSCPKWLGKILPEQKVCSQVLPLAYLRDGNLWIMDKQEKRVEEKVSDFDWLSDNKIAYAKNGALFIKDASIDKTVQLTGSVRKKIL